MNKLFLALSFGLLMFTSCEDINTFTLTDNQGTFILNQGDAQASTLSRYDYEKKEISTKVTLEPGVSTFQVARTDVYPSGHGFFVSADRNEVDVIDLGTYGFAGSIEDLSHPNDLLIADSKSAYVSCGDGIANGDKDNVVAKVNIVNNEVLTTIEVGLGPDKLVSAGKYLYVANKMEGTVSVIDMSTDVLIETVTVGGYPFDMAVDIDLNIWVYCNGDAAGSNQSLYVISRVPGGDVLTHSVEERVTLGPKLGNGKNALCSSLDGRFLYFVYGNTKRMSVYESTYRDAIHEDSKYKGVALSTISFESRTRKLQGLFQPDNGAGVLIVFGEKEESYIESEEYSVGINPIQMSYNY